MKSVNRRGLSAAILAMSAIHMSANVISPILGEIKSHLPEATDTGVQFLMTFPFLFVVVISLITGMLGERVNKKLAAIISLGLTAVSGLGAFFFHQSLAILYCWSAILGVAIGLIGPICASLIAIWYQGKARESMLGYQTSAQNLFSIAMTYGGGLLASIIWYDTYLVYLLVIPGIILTTLYIPDRCKTVTANREDRMTAGTRKRIPPMVFLFCGIAMMHMLLFFIAPTNVAMLVEERHLGGVTVVGTATTLLLVAGLIAGIIFGKLAAVIGRHTITIGYILLATGYAVLQGANSLPLLYTGMFIAGMSNAFIIPQCMASAVQIAPNHATLVNSLIFSLMNIGTFIAPLLTSLAAALFGSGAVGPRFILAGIVSAVCGCILGWVLQTKQK